MKNDWEILAMNASEMECPHCTFTTRILGSSLGLLPLLVKCNNCEKPIYKDEIENYFRNQITNRQKGDNDSTPVR